MRDERGRETLHVSIEPRPPLLFCLLNTFLRFQDVEEESNVDLEPTSDETNREQNNNSMFQQNLEIPQDNAMINAR